MLCHSICALVPCLTTYGLSKVALPFSTLFFIGFFLFVYTYTKMPRIPRATFARWHFASCPLAHFEGGSKNFQKKKIQKIFSLIGKQKPVESFIHGQTHAQVKQIQLLFYFAILLGCKFCQRGIDLTHELVKVLDIFQPTFILYISNRFNQHLPFVVQVFVVPPQINNERCPTNSGQIRKRRTFACVNVL
jgi:hypothetical protein